MPGNSDIIHIVKQARVAVLAKATRLIDGMAAKGGGSQTASELAASAGLPMGTACRLLRDLVVLGWADQDTRRGGYRLGPRARTLGIAQRHRVRFFAKARGELAALAESLRSPVVVACLRGTRRCILHEWHPAGIERRSLLEEHDDIWLTSTGRVLVAWLPTAERRKLLDIIKSPSSNEWPGVDHYEDLVDELRWIRRRNLAIRPAPRAGQASAAVMVPDGDGGRLAIGFRTESAQLSPAAIALLQEVGGRLSHRLE